MHRPIRSALALAVAASALQGCVAAVIPVMASGAIVGRGGDKDKGAQAEIPAPVPAAAPAPEPAPEPVPEPAPVSAPVAPQIQAPISFPPLPLSPAPPLLANPVSAQDTGSDAGFKALVEYARGVARAATADTPPLSAMLADPIATDGKRKLCDAGKRLLVLIDLDPAGRVFAAPPALAADPDRAQGLAQLRDAGVLITWLSDSPLLASGDIRTALEKAGLDPRGEDIIALRSDPDERKQTRRERLADISCVIAIAGDERTDFDERFRYLKDASVGVRLEAVIGDGWFLIEPLPAAAQ